MANNKIKVVGYAQRVFYNGGIEYRNFSDNLVGNQFTSDGGTTLFTAANFDITTNLDPKISKIFNTDSFGQFVSLEDLKLTHDQAVVLIENNTKIKLNLDKSDLTNYAYFGSLREFVRVSLESIIMNWPASIYVSPINEFNPYLSGPTYQNYSIDTLHNTTTFMVNSDRFINKYGINFLQNGKILNSFNDSNDLRNLSINFESYQITTTSGDYKIIGFTGATSQSNSNVYFKVEGEPFTNSGTTINYHIKPNELKVEEFFNNLNSFEDNLLNRFSTPKYTSTYTYNIETDLGNIITTEKSITWPVSDGYNIDFDTDEYITFVSDLLSISESSDLTKTNLMTRFLTSESIADFDTLPKVENGESESGQKMGNTLRIYGREFDEIKRYVDGISFANTVSYDKVKNTPDVVLKNLAKVMGWDLISSITEVDLVNNFLATGNNSFEGHSRGLTPAEAEVELWRRIILNTPWIWKSKGTRKVIEFLFKFIGSPDGLVSFNEFIYVAKNALDIDLFTDILEANDGSRDLTGLNIDSLGYPIVLPNTPDMYFQKAGLWYRETGGPDSNVDILTGNNPHIGPYDGGQEYINQFGCLIPNFEPVTLIKETVLTGSTNLFTNYDDGKFDSVFNNDVVLTTETDIDFSGMLLTQIAGCVNSLQIVPEFSGCSATTSWAVTAYLDGANIYEGIFGTNVEIIDGEIINGETLQPQYVNQIGQVYNVLNTNYSPILSAGSATSISFIEDLASCDDNSYYFGKNLRMELCLNVDYECAGGDCDPSSLIVTGIDEVTNQIYFGNVLDNVVPSTLCCTNLGYLASATTGGYYCYNIPPTITNNTNIYAYFDTTSMTPADGAAAHSALTAWFLTLVDVVPTYVGNLYTAPYSEEKYLTNSVRPWNGSTANLVNSAAWSGVNTSISFSGSSVPPPTSGDSEVIILHFIDETHSEYHSNTVAQGFGGGTVQPSGPYVTTYNTFVNNYPNYTFFRSLIYPIVRNVQQEGGALVLQVLAAIEGRLIPSNELPTTDVDVSLLTTQNPYVDYAYSGGVLQPLKNFGFQGRYDKKSPAANVFTSQTFTDDLNNFINNSN